MYIDGVYDTPTTFEFIHFQGDDPSLTFTWVMAIHTSFVNTPTHTYEYVNCNTYQVTLSVEDGNSCSDDYQTLAVVRCNPLADFYINNEPICDGDSVEFKNQSILVTGTNPVQWYWNFGDISSSQSQSNLENPVYLYDTALTSNSIYPVTLTVNDQVTSVYMDVRHHKKFVQIYDLLKQMKQILPAREI